jgi:hypothetical protein
VFLRLVTVDEDDEDTRRRVRDRTGAARARRAGPAGRAGGLRSGRLLTFDRDPITRGPTVEVAHEALLTEWERLRGWIDAVRDDLLTAAGSSPPPGVGDADRDPSFLLRGAGSRPPNGGGRDSGLPLTDEEDAYLARAAVDRRRRDLAAPRRRRTSAALAVALAATSPFSAVAVDQRSARGGAGNG